MKKCSTRSARLLCTLGLCTLGSVHAEPAALATLAAPGNGDWNFRALLDGKPIGRHRFSVTGLGGERTVVSEADFAVKVLGITAYRYRHKATEQWRGDCLSAIDSTTDDDGRNSTVRAASGDDLVKGCAMTFAYWNPAFQTQTRLLNAQTGKFEAVQVRRIGSGSVEVRGKAVEASGLRITGAAHPIDIWYSAQGEWIGLDSTVAGGRKLSYRIP